MSLSSKPPDESLRQALKSRFDHFEPDVPDRLESILEQLPAVPQRKPGQAAFRTALVTLLFILYYLPANHYPIYRHSPSSVHTPVRHTPAGEPTAQREAVRREVAPAPEMPVRKESLRAPAVSQPLSPDISGSRLLQAGAPAELPPPALPVFAVSMPQRLPAGIVQQGDSSPENPLPPEKRPKLTLLGGIGLNNTQYRVTILPQENLTVRNLQLPGFWNSVNWKPEAYLGADYKNWQVLLSYREFAQQLSYQLSTGEVEVAYKEDAGYKINMLGSSVVRRHEFRYAGLTLRKSIPLKKVPNSYVGLGGGYHAELSGRHHSLWGQIYAGRDIPLNEKVRFFIEGRLQYSFRRLTEPDQAIYAQPYQAGFTTGLRWRR